MQPIPHNIRCGMFLLWKTNDITASYIEQVEMIQKTLKEGVAQGSNPKADLVDW